MKFIMKSLMITLLLTINILSMRIDNDKSYSPINYALLMFVKNNNIDSVLKTLEFGADINVQNCFGKTALMLACQSDNLDLISLLLEKNPDLTIQDAYNKTALNYASENPNFYQIKEIFNQYFSKNKRSFFSLAIEEQNQIYNKKVKTDDIICIENYEEEINEKYNDQTEDEEEPFSYILDDEHIPLSDQENPSNSTENISQQKINKPYQCDQCDRSFAYKRNLTVHKKTHSGEKPHQCDQCYKTFAQKGNLTVHKRIHTGEKLYQCNQCNKNFTDQSNLKRHQKTHTGEKPYKCNQCDKAFSQKGGLTRHQRIHTQDKS